MGVFELWAVIKKKKFEPGVVKVIGPGSIYRLDLLSCLYIQIRQAFYSYTDSGSAYEAIHRALLKFTATSQPTPNIFIYLDGAWAFEKQETHNKRLDNASKALQKAVEHLNCLKPYVQNEKWPKKQAMGFEKALKRALTLTDEDKKGLAKYLQAMKWSVVIADYEADVQIARDCKDTDIVISRDSDMLVYRNVSIIWRPIAQGGFLTYVVDEVCDHLALPSRDHLTALGIVSKNDYNRNIRGLGSASNFSLIKRIFSPLVSASSPVKEIVQAYLKDPVVVHKNKDNIVFCAPLQVFVEMNQHPPSDSELKKCNDQIREGFEDLRAQYFELKDSYQIHQTQKKLSRLKLKHERDEYPVRHKSHQTFNKFRTVEHTGLLDRKRSRDNKDGGYTLQTQLNPRYKYSEVPVEPTRVSSDEIGTYKQFKKKKYKPREEVKDKKEAKKGKQEEGDEEESTGHDENGDEDLEAAGPITKNTTDRVRVKKILNKLHPTKSLEVGSLKRNVILTQKDPVISATEIGSSVVQTTDPSIQADRHPTQVNCTSVGIIDTRKKFEELTPTNASSRIIGVICSITDLWNYGKRKTQHALLNILSAESSSIYRSQLIEIFNDKCDRKKAAYTLQRILSRLLLNICGGKTGHQSKSSDIVKLADNIYELLKNTLDQNTPMEHNIAVSAMVIPLSLEMAKSITMHWKTQSEVTIEKIKKSNDAFNENGIPSQSLLARFLYLREQMDLNKRPATVPVSPIRGGFMTMTEKELLECIYNKYRDEAMKALGMEEAPTMHHLLSKLGELAPGRFLSNLLCTLDRKKKGYFRQIEVTNPLPVGQDDYAPNRRYTLTGTFQTNGLQLRLLAYDTRTLKGFKATNVAPGRTVPEMGTQRWLSEIRNTFKNVPEDVNKTFGHYQHSVERGREDICIGGIDLGQVVTAAVSVYIPTFNAGDSRPSGGFRNLKIKQKALMQPQFRYRKVLEKRKTEDIRDMEASILPKKGVSDTDIQNYVQSVGKLKGLDDYYNSTFRHRRDTWDMKKARDAEDRIAINAILDMVKNDNKGNPIPPNKVLWVIGLGKFNTGSKLTSLHGTFGSKLISALRTKGHAVVGINEYYTSKKCPWNKPAPGKTCGHGFVGQANMRRMYCPGCMMPFHRDCMAAQNMVRATQSILSTGTRPLDLQPLDDNNQPIWQ